MHALDRAVVAVGENDEPKGIITFFITDTPDKVERNGIWGIPKENAKGKYLVIDRVISDRKTSVRNNLLGVIEYFNKRFSDKEVVWQSRNKGLICPKEKICATH